MTPVPLPQGFSTHVANVGIKDTTDDFVVLASDRPAVAAAVFTRSRFAGPSVELSRRHAADGQLRAIVCLSKNANVATGAQGSADATELAAGVAAAIGCQASDVLVTSTGVIGRPLPMGPVRDHLSSLEWPFTGTDARAAAVGMMTTDTHPKTAVASVDTIGGGPPATIVGVAKGVGMIEPDMATMLAFVLTDAKVSAAALDASFRAAVDRTFNSLSVDTDTSTSDTAVVLANGAAGPVDPAAFGAGLDSVLLDLTRQLASDGEGATKLLVVTVSGAADVDQARAVAKSVVNSPLVKTAVHGADPNWGRVAMAVGKCSQYDDIDQERVTIRFGDREVYPDLADDERLAELEKYLAGDEVQVRVDLGIGDAEWTVYGCDLSDGYVRINADYTT